MSCGVGRRRGLYPKLLWLWHRPVATASIQPLAWEPPCSAGAALEKAKKTKKKNDLYLHSSDGQFFLNKTLYLQRYVEKWHAYLLFVEI